MTAPNLAATGVRDLRSHIEALDRAGLLHRIDEPINKDTEMHPLVRWQYRGGIPEKERKAFLFTNVVDGSGKRYEWPVLVAGLAGSRDIYSIGLECALEEVGARWDVALANPLPPLAIAGPAPAQEVVHEGDELAAWGGLLNFPVPVSTPGYDAGPFLTSAVYVTKDPETGIRNAAVYRGQLKSATTVAIQFSTPFKDARMHWLKAKERGEHLPVAIVLGGPPTFAYAAVQRVGIDVDEFAVAGGLAGQPMRTVKCRTIDLDVPADAEIVIEGWVRTDYVESEGPFGESNGFINPRTQSPVVEVTCVTHRKDPIFSSFISQVTPSESSAIKLAAFEPMILNFLRSTCSIKSLVKVHMHEPLTNLRPVLFLQFSDTNDGEVWRALKLASSFQVNVGKVIVAVDEDIDPNNLDAILWAMAYRMIPHRDVQIVRGFYSAFPEVDPMENSCLLMNATLRGTMPPISLPKREFMETSLALWRKLNLPPVTPQAPWFGYSLGAWSDDLEDEAVLATQGRWTETGAKAAAERKPV